MDDRKERERENETKRRLCWICKEPKLKDEGSTSMSFNKRHEPNLKDKCALLDETENTNLTVLLCPFNFF